MIQSIVAVSKNGIIGKDNQIPWRIHEDIRWFKDNTFGHTVIMGRATFDSLDKKYKPMPMRNNIVVTRNYDFRYHGVDVVHSIHDALEKAKSYNTDIFIIGGGDIYAQTMHLIDRLYITIIDANFEGDTYFPDFTEFSSVLYQKSSESNGVSYTFFIKER